MIFSRAMLCTYFKSIVKDGINEVADSISRICGAVKYVRSSLGRVLQFQACVDQEGITL